jgi:hypothetical protein
VAAAKRKRALRARQRTGPAAFTTWPYWKVIGGVLGGLTAILGLIVGGLQILEAFRERDRQREPVAVHVERQVEPTCLVKRWYSETPPTVGSVPAVPSDKGLRARWDPGAGAIPVGNTVIRVTVQGRSGSAVVLQGFDVEVVQRSRLRSGVVFPDATTYCTELLPRQVAVDLNEEVPRLELVPEMDASGKIVKEAYPFSFQVDSSKPEQFLVVPRSADCDCRFRLFLKWIADGRAGRTQINDPENPFRELGYASLPRYGFRADTQRWEPCPPAGCDPRKYRAIMEDGS